MAKTFVAPADVIPFTAGADQVAGDVLVLGGIANGIVGVVEVAVANGALGQLNIRSAHKLPKNTSTALAQGERVYWDSSPGELTTTAAGNTWAGAAYQDELAGTATGIVILNHGADQAGV